MINFDSEIEKLRYSLRLVIEAGMDDIPRNALSLRQKQLSLLDHIPIGECVLRFDGTVLFWNACLEQWTAISRAQIVGRKIYTYFPHLSQAKYMHRLRETFEGGLPLIFSHYLHPHFLPCPMTGGRLRIQHTAVTAIPAAEGIGFDALLSIQDVTDLQPSQPQKFSPSFAPERQHLAIEQQFCHDHALLDAILNSSAAAIVVTDIHGTIIFANQRGEDVLELTPSSLTEQGYAVPEWTITDAEGTLRPNQQLPSSQVMQSGQPVLDLPRVLVWADGRCRFLSINGSPLRDEAGQVTGVVFSIDDITTQKQAAETLKQRYEQERLVDRIVQQIRQSLNLQDILQTAVTAIHKVLKADRLLISRLESPDGKGRVVAESCNPDYPSLLAWTMQIPLPENLESNDRSPSAQPWQAQALSDITQSQLDPAYIQFLQRFAVKARLVIPIVLSDRLHETDSGEASADTPPANLWGWLIAHDCQANREWQPEEINLLRRLESQLAVAIRQSELHRQVQQLNLGLERQVHARTLELEQALSFEATLKCITDKVRDSLDEHQILHAAVEELAKALEVLCCNTTLYNSDRRASSQYHYAKSNRCFDNREFCIEELFDVYNCLFGGEHIAFCRLKAAGIKEVHAILACPILDDQEVLGDLWLFKPAASSFSRLEVCLVQQVANQCAIAIRQAQLYKAAQQQVEELARLNHLKDDFLSTISHELRTPIASIRMTLQTLEEIFKRPGNLATDLNQAGQCFHILEDECQREAKLIDDLLDLTRLDAGTEPLLLTPVVLQAWLPHVTEVFERRIQEHQQILVLNLPDDLPPVITDLTILERIIMELLNNACKYTPPAGTIAITAKRVDMIETDVNKTASPDNQSPLLLKTVKCCQDSCSFSSDRPSPVLPALPSPPSPASASLQRIQICISNTGVEIPNSELSRIFDKFYRIPNHDPWKYGGTGLGLALVRRMAEYLGGTVWAESQNDETHFTVELMPIAAPISTGLKPSEKF